MENLNRMTINFNDTIIPERIKSQQELKRFLMKVVINEDKNEYMIKVWDQLRDKMVYVAKTVKRKVYSRCKSAQRSYDIKTPDIICNKDLTIYA